MLLLWCQVVWEPQRLDELGAGECPQPKEFWPRMKHRSNTDQIESEEQSSNHAVFHDLFRKSSPHAKSFNVCSAENSWKSDQFAFRSVSLGIGWIAGGNLRTRADSVDALTSELVSVESLRNSLWLSSTWPEDCARKSR